MKLLFQCHFGGATKPGQTTIFTSAGNSLRYDYDGMILQCEVKIFNSRSLSPKKFIMLGADWNPGQGEDSEVYTPVN